MYVVHFSCRVGSAAAAAESTDRSSCTVVKLMVDMLAGLFFDLRDVRPVNIFDLFDERTPCLRPASSVWWSGGRCLPARFFVLQ